MIGTVAHEIEQKIVGTKITILPSDYFMGSPIAKFVLYFVGIRKRRIFTSLAKDNVFLLEALIDALEIPTTPVKNC